MVLRSVLQARAIQWMQMTKSAYLPDVVKRVQERYHFVYASENMAEVVAKDLPLGFRHGKLELPDKLVVIDGIALHRRAIIVDVGTNTDDCDEVMNDLMAWATDTFEISRGPRLYASQLEVQLAIDLARAFPQLTAVSDRIVRFNRSINSEFEFHRPEMFFSGITLLPDPAGSALAAGFRLERREGQPYSANLYFAEAPLSTTEHIGALTDLEAELTREG